MNNPSEPPNIRSCLLWIFRSPNEPRLRAGWRLTTQFALMEICFLIIGGILVALLRLSPSSPSLFFYSEVIAALAVTLSVFLARRLFDHRSFASLGFSIDRRALVDLLVGIGLPGLMLGLVFGIEWAAGWLNFEGFAAGQGLQLLGQTAGTFFLFVLVGWQEELLSRGYWLQNLADGLNLTWGVIISSLIFALAHWSNPDASWVAVVGLVCDGLFLAFGYVRTRRMWLPIGLHIGWNFFEGCVYGFPVSGIGEITHLIHQTVQGPALVTGGAFGPEAGLIQLPALLVGVLCIVWYTSKKRESTNLH